MSKPAGYLYWKSSDEFGITVQRYPIDSGTPVGSYLAKFPLNEEEMNLSLDELKKRYPMEEEVK